MNLGNIKENLVKYMIITSIIIIVVTISIAVIVQTVRDREKGERTLVYEEKVNELEEFGIDLSAEQEYTIKEKESTGADYNLPEKIEDGTMLFAWCWSFDTITRNLSKIAEAGYNAVQTSPVNLIYGDSRTGLALKDNGEWYYQKENIDWTIGNYQLGTKEELEILCDEAEKFGIKILVEVRPNELSAQLKETDNSLTKAVGIDSLFHKNANALVGVSNNRLYMLTRSAGMHLDANTENHSYQDYFIKFLKECIDVGVDGFRFGQANYIGLKDETEMEDSARENDFYKNVLGDIREYKKDIFVYGDYSIELAGEDDFVCEKYYYYSEANATGVNERKYGTRYARDYAEEFGYISSNVYNTNLRRQLVREQKISSADLEKCHTYIADLNKMVVSIEGYDEYTSDTWRTLGKDQIKIAWAIMAARGKGIPLFFNRPSGIDLTNNDSGWTGLKNQIGIEGDSLYRDSDIVELNRFSNLMVGEEENLVNTDDGSMLMIERGNRGVVLINLSTKMDDNNECEVNFSTNLSEGMYVSRTNTDYMYTVKDGKLTGKIPGRGIMVLYGNAEENTDFAKISIEGYNDFFYEDEVTLKMNVENAKNATFSLGGKSYLFEESKEITLGSAMDIGDSFTLTIKAESESGNISEKTYTMIKKYSSNAGTTVMFRKPDTWGDSVYIYYYTVNMGGESLKEEGTKFPGVLMERIADGLFKFSIPDGFDENGRLNFTDGCNQYPAPMKKGLEVVGGKTYFIGVE